ncbi:DUF1775 domain-containing protein [Nocardia lasii]|uniref:DUF1775 domain-containing protein n=1 Tax=Nocardia lasii TaxID=1616107 RepID=A0ABW1JMQ1_9NOCA
MAHNDFRTVPARRGLATRCAAVLSATVVAAIAFAAPAAAHVRSDGAALPQGGYGIVRLIVPGESDTAATVGLTVTIPAGIDLKSARTQPVPGWRATIERERVGEVSRVSKIVWTAVDPTAGYSGAEYREFAFSAGPWPADRTTLALPSDQNYSDGTTVSWNEVAVDKASEPEHPAPVVALTAAGADHDSGHDPATPDQHAAPAADSDGLWRALSVVNLAVALAALAGLVVVVRRGRGVDS